MYKIKELSMQEELDSFFEEHENSIKEKMKLLIDFSEGGETDIFSTQSSIINKMQIEPVRKSNKRVPKSSHIVEIIDLKKLNNNKNKNKLF